MECVDVREIKEVIAYLEKEKEKATEKWRKSEKILLDVKYAAEIKKEIVNLKQKTADLNNEAKKIWKSPIGN